MTTFAEACDALTERATGTATMHAAAQAMADTLGDVAAGYVGGDLTIGRAGRISVEPASGEGVASVQTGGAYALADGGRSRRVMARASNPRRGLRTPWGPRASVQGSTWAGFDLTSRAQGDVLDAGKQAIRDRVSAP